MSRPFRIRTLRSSSALLGSLTAVSLLAAPAMAQEAMATAAKVPAPASAPGQSPSDSLAVNVVRRMVAKGLLSQADADDLIAGAEADTAKAKAREAAQGVVAATTGAAAVTAQADNQGAMVRVPYVPENVREDIKNELKTEMTQEAKDEHWATPNTFPDWVSRIKVFGDFRFRDESHYYDKNNFYGFVDPNAFNGAGPIDVNNTPFPIYNSLKDRNLLQIRARLGFTATISDQISTTIRIATGNDNGPISTTQTLGGDFGKKNLWLDQAFLTYKPITGAALNLGRFANPFTATEVLFKQDDFNVDGAALSYSGPPPYLALNGLTVHATGGAFPLEFAPDEFPTTAPAYLKTADVQKWLFAGQAGVDYAITPRLVASGAIGYYYYDNVEGAPSSCQYTDQYCFTDPSRPAYLQKGNTLLFLRPVNTNPITNASPQYLGLASGFKDFDLLGRLDYAVRPRVHVILTGDYVKNFGFNANTILARAGGVDGLANNNETCVLPSGAQLAPGQDCAAGGGTNVFKSGDTAWLARIGVGAPTIDRRGDWRVSLAYLHIDPDAVLDAFDDKDFRLGGSNSKGFIVEGDLGVARNTWMVLKWLSADAVDGPPFSVDVLQVDLNTRF